jgi:ParB-like chromosome segregation protein Spo0J
MERWDGQPRTEFDQDYILGLAASMACLGYNVQHIIIRPHPSPHGDVQYQIVAGECRYRAAKAIEAGDMAIIKSTAALVDGDASAEKIKMALGKPFLISCICRPIPDSDMGFIALVENIQRRSLTPMEEARFLQRVMKDKGWTTAAQAANGLGMKIGWVASRLQMCKLSPVVQEMVHRREINATQASALGKIKNHNTQAREAQHAVTHKVAAAEIKERIRDAALRGQVRVVESSRGRQAMNAAEFGLNALATALGQVRYNLVHLMLDNGMPDDPDRLADWMSELDLLPYEKLEDGFYEWEAHAKRLERIRQALVKAKKKRPKR